VCECLCGRERERGTTERFKDFGKLNLIRVWWFNFRLDPIFNIAQAASKNYAQFKSGQNGLKNNHFVTHSVESSEFELRLTLSAFYSRRVNIFLRFLEEGF